MCIRIHLSFLDTVYFLIVCSTWISDNRAVNQRLWSMPICNIIGTQFIPQKGEIGLKLLFYWHLCAQNEAGLTFASTRIQLLVLLLLPAAFLLVVRSCQAVRWVLNFCHRDNGCCCICLKMWQLPGLNISKYVRIVLGLDFLSRCQNIINPLSPPPRRLWDSGFCLSVGKRMVKVLKGF